MRRIALAVALVVFVCGLVYADTVILKNGGRLRGRITKETDKEVIIEVSRMGTVTVDRDRIREIIRERHSDPVVPKPSEPEKPQEPEKPEEPEEKPKPSEKPETPERQPAADSLRPKKKVQDAPFLQKAISIDVRKKSMDKVLEQIARDAGISIDISKEAKWHMDMRAKQRNTVSCKKDDAAVKEVLDDVLGDMVFEMGFVIVKDFHILVMTKDELARAEAYKAGDGIAWDDAKGDAESVAFAPQDWKKPDVTKVQIEGKDKYIHVTLTFKDNLKPMLDRKDPEGKHHGHMLVQLYLDTDDSEKTGDPMSYNPRRVGYDFKLEISSGFDFQDDNGNKMKQWGNISTIPGVHTVNNTLVAYTVWPAGTSSGLRKKDPAGKGPEELTTIEGNKVVAKIHYDSLKLKAGQKVRACFEDGTQGLMDEGRISHDGTFTLK